ncbi:MAG: alpha/beta hydrolase [Planctomycetota bacterium]|nr:alpha/beta hydrolase [Planctomycetota bacterium]
MADDVAFPPLAPPTKFWRRRYIRLLRIGLLIYLGLILVFYFLQTSLIFPGAATKGQRDALLHPGANYELLMLRAKDGSRIAAIFGKALQPDGQPVADADKRPSVLYFYGNGACMAYSMDIFDHFRRMGVNVIIPDFEGYGMSDGAPSEVGCYAAADAAYDYLLSRADIDHSRFIATGWSLGGAVAIDLASRRPVVGLATFSAFTRMADMAHHIMPYLPTSLFLKFHFDNRAKIKTIAVPTLLAHGTIDDIVPPRMCNELAAVVGGKVTCIRVEGGGHNDIFDVGGQSFAGSIQAFFEQFK